MGKKKKAESPYKDAPLALERMGDLRKKLQERLHYTDGVKGTGVISGEGATVSENDEATTIPDRHPVATELLLLFVLSEQDEVIKHLQEHYKLDDARLRTFHHLLRDAVSKENHKLINREIHDNRPWRGDEDIFSSYHDTDVAIRVAAYEADDPRKLERVPDVSDAWEEIDEYSASIRKKDHIRTLANKPRYTTLEMFDNLLEVHAPSIFRALHEGLNKGQER